jgi:hypothetical protein
MSHKSLPNLTRMDFRGAISYGSNHHLGRTRNRYRSKVPDPHIDRFAHRLAKKSYGRSQGTIAAAGARALAYLGLKCP